MITKLEIEVIYEIREKEIKFLNGVSLIFDLESGIIWLVT